jgi:hypothetical protein
MAKVTSIEQSDRLVELGLDISTADMSYVMEPFIKDDNIHYLNDYSLTVLDYKTSKGMIDKYFNQFKPFADAKPAWTLSALLDAIPGSVFDNQIGSGGLVMYKTMDNKKFRFAYHGIYTTAFYEEPIDAVMELIEWLFDNGYLKKDKQ